MKRFASTFVLSYSLTVLGAVVGPASIARADSDVVVLDALFGGAVSKFSGDKTWQPSLWVDGTYGVAGPLHLGGYFQWLGKNFPLEDPGLGGGGMLALRWNVKHLRLTGAFTGGYLRVPLPDSARGAGTIGAFGGLGYGFLSWMGFD
ncbi:MAG: hypothetical protein WCE62_20065, partial [Polyangiales bacterium]